MAASSSLVLPAPIMLRIGLQARGEILTGLLYVSAAAQDLHAHLKTVEMPLNRLAEAELCPGRGGAGGDQCGVGLRALAGLLL